MTTPIVATLDASQENAVLNTADAIAQAGSPVGGRDGNSGMVGYFRTQVKVGVLPVDRMYVPGDMVVHTEGERP